MIPENDRQLDDERLPGVSIIIAARNEESNILPLIRSLTRVQYPDDKLEVIVIDDASEDRTPQYLQDHMASRELFQWLTLENLPEFRGSYKKRALTCGINRARFPVIITTDADCEFNAGWVRAMVETLVAKDLVMACGPVNYTASNWLSPVLNTELACLMAIGAVSIYSGNSTMCNGANLCFYKKAFNTVNGYKGFEHIASGDDEFLLYKLNQQYPGKIGFVKQRQAIVNTNPPSSLTDFFNQRKRWSGKWKEHRSVAPRVLALFIFGFHLMFITVILITLFGVYSWKVMAVQLLTKLLMEFFLVSSVFGFLGKRPALKWILLMQLLYSLYVVIVGVAVQFFGFSWKNRQY